MKKAIILLSGGLDSATCLAMAKEQGFACYALSFDFGQKHRVELGSAVAIAKKLNALDHKILSIGLGALGGSALTDHALAVPDYQKSDETIPSTYVPARNTIFLSVALGWAEIVGAFDIFYGANFILLDENGKVSDQGEVALIPPAIGLSTQLLNADHHQIYFAGMPIALDGTVLRRHGDELRRYPNHYFCMLGRIDDTMKLGGIKTSAADIERVLVEIPGIIETAAIAVSETQGPCKLAIYAATQRILSTEEKISIKQLMQEKISHNLNPLFKIEHVFFLPELPKTASNKIMRRVLRHQYPFASTTNSPT